MLEWDESKWVGNLRFSEREMLDKGNLTAEEAKVLLKRIARYRVALSVLALEAKDVVDGP